jgi:hypothetical protein
MSIQPQAIAYAFHTLYYGGQDKKKRAVFAQRWGGFSDKTFLQTLASGSREEKALAILALGQSSVPNTDEFLSTRLESTEPLERWARALALGERRDERALPLSWMSSYRRACIL